MITPDCVRYIRKKNGKSGNRRAAEEHVLLGRLSPIASNSDSIACVDLKNPPWPLSQAADAHGDDIIAARQGFEDRNAHIERPGQEEGPEMLHARMTEPETTRGTSGGPSQTTGRTVYMRECFNLTYVVKTVCSPSSREGESENDVAKLPYSAPADVADRSIDARAQDTEEPLPFRNAFITPSQDVSDELVRTFFTCVHPAYPVFDRLAFVGAYQHGQVSVLVLHAIYFLAVTVCDEDLITRAGYSNRENARKTHYLRAKALYDADYETDRVNLVAVLFLLGFWWAGPEDQKDSWHWLGSAISLAQTLGMHRS